jgi:hypothetical protein
MRGSKYAAHITLKNTQVFLYSNIAFSDVVLLEWKILKEKKIKTAGSKLRENGGKVDDLKKTNFSITTNSEEQSLSW